MLKITALNESEDEDSGEDVSLTKEAQEAIAEFEYMRAIRLKCDGKVEHALLLLQDLLETKVLNEISIDKKNDKLLAIRYNCYKNIAFIFEERKEVHKALQNYVLATKLDENDVYTMSRLGHLALKTKQLDMADYAFENCLYRNPFHWAAAEGMLRLLCQNNNIIGAYSWAIKILLKDPNYNRALDVVSEINNMFPDILSFYETVCLTPKVKFSFRKKVASLLTNYESAQETAYHTYEPIILNKLQIEEINWLTVGKHITCKYKNFKASNTEIMFVLDINCLHKTVEVTEQNTQYLESYKTETLDKEKFQETVINISKESGMEAEADELDTSEQEINEAHNLPSVEGSENISHPIHQAESTNEDLDSNLKNDNIDNYKPKSRRRCSDLHFLEQWGWHKNRRYSSRKKNQPDIEIDASFKGYLERVFSKHMKKNFEKAWPFGGNSGCSKIDTSFEKCYNIHSIQKFQKETQIGFDNFLTELQKSHFDILSLIYKWLKFVSEYWTLSFPEDLKTVYISVFALYKDHFDISSWNLFSKKNLIDAYQICLLFLELEYERVVHLKSNISYCWKSLLNHLIYYSACDYIISDKNYNINLIRLINMEYSSTNYENNLIKSVECLEQLEGLVDLESNDFKLHLPNLTNVSISKELVKHTRKDLLRKIQLNKVPKLFEEKKWSELVNIIQDNLQHTSNLEGCEYWIRDLKTQFEVLLQALWNMCDVENCLIWSEMCFDFVVDKFFKEVDEDLHQSCWAESINYILTYLESSIIYEGYETLNSLGENLPRLIQNVIRVLSFHLDPPYDRHSNSNHDLDVKQPVVVLHQILLREESKNPVMIRPNHLDIDGEEIDDLIPQSFLILFTAHEFLGKRQLCTQGNGALLLYILDVITPNLRAPLYDSCRDIVYEYLEQVTYCLYGFPPKKARSRHIEEHESTPIEISWINGLQLFDLYRPESLPGFNSYKLESVSGDMEQLLLKVVSLMPKQFESTSATLKILQFISGVRENCPDESDCIKLPYKISSIYYLLADYYFKNRDLSKALKYYTLDLACNPTRLDSWAGMALSKQSKIETKLNDFLSIELTSFLNECEDTIRCFEQCIRLNQTQTLIWIEYGSFCYCIHSFCSRHLKQLLHKMSLEKFSYVEEKKESMLNKAYHCFTLAANLLDNSVPNDMVDGESFEEKWLCQYMLGKITEKRKEKPKVYINYYLTAAHYLYESSATYPIKINHSNPTPLSVEALEVFYRTNSAIIKFLEHEKKIERETGVYFKKVLKNLSRSPFAFNKAKIDGNSLNVLKRKISPKSEDISFSKQTKVDSDQKSLAPVKSKDDSDCDLLQNTKDVRCLIKDDRVLESSAEKHSESLSMDDMFFQKSSPTRRNSNESSATAGSTTTESASSSTSSSTNSSDASSTGSESENESDNTKTDHKKIEENAFYTKEELLFLYDSTVKNLEECATRFPEHYKSIYRLVYHYMNAPEEIRNLDRCEQLLLGQYTTNLGNQVNGIFFDRKSNNIFNGIWKLPSTEIDRPGSFSTHLVKCVSILIQMLLKRNNYKLLIDIGLQLYKTPDNDKRYIKDMERIELYQQSVNFCVQIMRDIFRNKSKTRNDSEILTLLIDIYKTHKKCVKHINQKEPLFTQLLTEVYKFYIQDKIEKIPENLNFLDLAIKLCLQEISSRKNQEKTFSDISNGTNLDDIVLDINNSPQVSGLSGINSSLHIPGLLQKAKNRTNVAKYNPNSSLTYTELSPSLLKKDAFKGQLDYSSSAALMNPFELKSFTDLSGFQGLVAEYYKLFDCGNSRSIHMSLQQKLNSQRNSLEQAHSSASLLPAETSITPFNCNPNVENVATQNFSLDDIQATCSKISNSTNHRESDLVLSSEHSSFSDHLNVNNSLSLFIAPPNVSERNNSKPFDTLYNPINTKEMLSSAMFYKPFADNSNNTTGVTPLTKQDSTLKQTVDPTTAFLHFAENLFNPVNDSKTKKPKQLTPYSDQMIQSESNKGHFQLVDASTDIKQYNQSTTFLTAYTDLINNSQPTVSQASTAQTPSSCQKRTIIKRMPKSKVGLNTRDEAKKKLQTVHPYKTQTVTLNAASPSINTGSFNLHTSTILPSSFKTSLQNISNSSLENSTEPLKTSPKTLQQKLAERQRASQQNDACETSHNNKASEIDLIILD